MTLETLNAHVDDSGIATLALSRSTKRNALSIQLRDELTATLAAWAEDPSIRVVILTGEGPAFCAGFDLDEFATPGLAHEIAASSRRYHLAVWSFPKPLIAAVNGPALAGGLDLAVLCDVRLASATAVFGHPEITFGAPPMFTPLRWIVGDGIARDLCLSGRQIDATEALRIGLVSSVHPADELGTRAKAYAETLAQAPQAALEATKAYLTANADHGFTAAFAIEHDNVFAQHLSQPIGPRAAQADPSSSVGTPVRSGRNA